MQEQRESGEFYELAPIEDGFKTPDLPEVGLAAVCIARNEAPYIREWIEYHRIVGVERFYFHDNGSGDNTREVLEPYIRDGVVVYRPISGDAMQLPVYRDAVLRYREQCRWMAIIDLDEFVVPKEKDTIPEFLEGFGESCGVGINWVLFDSNGHETKPTAHGGLVTANYTRVKQGHGDPQKGNKWIKSIVDPRKVRGFPTIHFPHYPVYLDGMHAVTENGEPLQGATARTHSSARIQVNHYRVKSREEYLRKLERGRAAVKGRFEFNESNLNYKKSEQDHAVDKYLPRLMEALGIRE